MVLPPATQSRSEASVEAARAARCFHRGDAAGAGDLARPADDFVPVHLAAFRNVDCVPHDYPLLVLPAAAAQDDQLAVPLADALAEAAARVTPDPDEMRTLIDNLPRLVLHAHREVEGFDVPIDAATCLTEAGRRMENELMLAPESASRLRADLARVIEALPHGGRLLALTEETPLALFVIAARHRARARRAALREDLARMRASLEQILATDVERGPGGHRPDSLRHAVGAVGERHLDPQALARVLGSPRGTVPMASDRCARIERAIAAIDLALDDDQTVLVTIVGPGDRPDAWCEDGAWHSAEQTDVCRVAAQRFDDVAAAHAPLFAAMRTGRLEIANAYDPHRHDPALAGLTWPAFSREELLSLPLVAAVACPDHLAGEGMADLSRLLRSGRPVEVVVPVRPAASPGAEPETDPLLSYRCELGYLGIGHREALVHQSSAARPAHLLGGYLRSLDAAATSLHLVASGLTWDGGAPALGAWLHAGAAMEGRAHPLFHYDPEAGATWARRFDFDENPQPEIDWPIADVTGERPGTEPETFAVAFTFADFALLEPRFHDHFRVVPADCPEEELTPLAAFMELPPEKANERVPFIWAADKAGHLHRVVVSRQLVFASEDRLDYWRTLQELAGVRNEHVREAVECERERLNATFADERAALERTHADELEHTRRVAAGDTMRRLAERLLQTDVSSFAEQVTAPTDTPPAPAPSPLPETPAPAAEPVPTVEQTTANDEEEEDDDEPASEPWIESVLCTSCNDCLDINPQVFVYNANKQARIGDAQAGTFAQLVQAAEKCPARCIHPGAPADPNEPDLVALVERAQPFN